MNTYKIITILSLFGILLAMYLLWEQLPTTTIRPCTINSVINCDAVIDGPVSKTLGIATPLYGLIGYIIIAYAAVKRLPKVIFGVSLFGLLFCLRIAYIELAILKVICPVCILCQLIMISIFILSLPRR
jgi:uncharacterized membrane protein